MFEQALITDFKLQWLKMEVMSITWQDFI